MGSGSEIPDEIEGHLDTFAHHGDESYDSSTHRTDRPETTVDSGYADTWFETSTPGPTLGSLLCESDLSDRQLFGLSPSHESQSPFTRASFLEAFQKHDLEIPTEFYPHPPETSADSGYADTIVGSTQSEANFRPKRLFKCDDPDCPPSESFGTINDLAFHKRWVHNKEPERRPKMMYMCFGVNCPRPNKRWPRLDNFKQHLSRMHHEEDGEVLLER